MTERAVDTSRAQARRNTPSEADLLHYDGLVGNTALMLAGHVELPVEDIKQILAIKAWRALCAYDPAKARGMNRDRYVFMCVRDQAKDLAKKRKRRELFIEDLSSDDGSNERVQSRDTFDSRYLSSTHDETYGRVEDDDCVMPNTLTVLEQEIVVLLYRDYKQSEAARHLGIEKPAMEKAVRSIRRKLADWKPDPEPVVTQAELNSDRRYSSEGAQALNSRAA